MIAVMTQEHNRRGSVMMGKVRWHTMMSLDGFIAGPNDDMQWAFGLDSKPSPTIEEVLRSTGALLVGRRT
jgi:dihydrofolate reductase